MEILSSNPFNGSLKKFQRRGGNNFEGSITQRKTMKTVRFGGSPQRAWKIKAVPKLRFKMVLSSPLRLWRKLKNGYVNMMLNLGGGGNGTRGFGEKRVPKARHTPMAYSTTEFDNRLVLEIYKSLVTSRELGPSL